MERRGSEKTNNRNRRKAGAYAEACQSGGKADHYQTRHRRHHNAREEKPAPRRNASIRSSRAAAEMLHDRGSIAAGQSIGLDRADQMEAGVVREAENNQDRISVLPADPRAG